VRHEVDATKLDQAFTEKKFENIIFMFPHTGGKTKIK
jgi:hypothetical protein